MKQKFQNTFFYAFLLLFLFSILKPIAPLFPLGYDVVAMIALCFQLYLPLWIIHREGASYQDYKLYFYGFFAKSQTKNWRGFLSDLGYFLSAIILTFTPYIFIYHLLLLNETSFNSQILTFNLTFPDNFFQMLIINTFIVALPEEVFYRSFLQTRLLKIWPNQRFLFLLPLGRSILITNLFFALAHFIGDFNYFRLLTFFPGLVFSFLTYYSKSIMGAVIYHALCNVLSAVLSSSYTWS